MLFVPLAAAQDGSAAPEPDMPAAPPAAAASTPPGPDFGAPADVARAAHLDGLFARLADPGAEDWRRVQAQIWTAWSETGSASMNLLLLRATRAMETKDYDTALIHLNNLVRLDPDFAEGWNKRATVHFLREEYGRSVSDIERTLALEPRHFGALSGLGIILDRTGDKEGALTAYRAALAVHPNMEGAQAAVEKLSKDVEGRDL